MERRRCMERTRREFLRGAASRTVALVAEGFLLADRRPRPQLRDQLARRHYEQYPVASFGRCYRVGSDDLRLGEQRADLREEERGERRYRHGLPEQPHQPRSRLVQA